MSAPSLVSELSHTIGTPYTIARERIERGHRSAFKILAQVLEKKGNIEIIMMLLHIAYDLEGDVSEPKVALRRKLYFYDAKQRIMSADEFMLYAFLGAMLSNNIEAGERIYDLDIERSRDVVINKSLCGCCFPAVRGKKIAPQLREIILRCCEVGSLVSIKWILETYEPAKRDFVPTYDFFEECIQHSAHKPTKVLLGDIRTVMYPGDDMLCCCCG